MLVWPFVFTHKLWTHFSSPQAELDTFKLLSQIKRNSPIALAGLSFQKSTDPSVTAFQLCELCHRVSGMAKRSWLCDHTRISRCSCLFPMLRALVHRHFREGIECAGFP